MKFDSTKGTVKHLGEEGHVYRRLVATVGLRFIDDYRAACGDGPADRLSAVLRRLVDKREIDSDQWLSDASDAVEAMRDAEQALARASTSAPFRLARVARATNALKCAWNARVALEGRGMAEVNTER